MFSNWRAVFPEGFHFTDLILDFTQISLVTVFYEKLKGRPIYKSDQFIPEEESFQWELEIFQNVLRSGSKQIWRRLGL